MLIHNTDIQPLCANDVTSFQPRINNGINKMAPIKCSNETISNAGRKKRFCLRNPSKLQRMAAKITERAGRYFFIRRNYIIYWGGKKPLKRFLSLPGIHALGLQKKEWIIPKQLWVMAGSYLKMINSLSAFIIWLTLLVKISEFYQIIKVEKYLKKTLNKK